MKKTRIVLDPNEAICDGTTKFFADHAQDFNEAEFLAAMQEIPTVEPEEEEELKRETRR